MRWRRNPRVLWRIAPGYLVLATVDGVTVEIAGPAGDIWARLAGWTTDEELTAALTAQYGADDALVSLDVGSLLHQLHAQGYVDRND